MRYPYGFGEEWLQGEVPLHRILLGQGMTFTWLATGDISLDQLIKLVAARFFHCEVNNLPLSRPYRLDEGPAHT